MVLYTDTEKIVKKEIKKGEDTEGKKKLCFLLDAQMRLLNTLLADGKFS